MSKPEAYTMIVYNKADAPIGTAFLVHESGLLATCYHILRDIYDNPGGQMITLRSLNSKSSRQGIVLAAANIDYDVGMMQLIGNIDQQMQPARLISSQHVQPGTDFSLTGYAGDINKKGQQVQFQYMSAFGKIVGKASQNGCELLQLDSKQIQQGMSGGGVYVAEVGGLVGILSRRYTIDPKSNLWLRDTGWATPIEILANLDARLILSDPQPPDKESLASKTIINNTAQSGGRIINMTGDKARYVEGNYIEGNYIAGDYHNDSSST